MPKKVLVSTKKVLVKKTCGSISCRVVVKVVIVVRIVVVVTA